METGKGVRPAGRAPVRRDTLHKEKLTIRQLMVSSPLHAAIGTVQSV